MYSVYCSLAPGLLSSSQLEWAALHDNILRSNTHYTHSLVDDCLKNLHERILRKPFASTPDGPPAPFVLKAACLTISPFISVYTDSGYCPSIGPKSSEPNLADWGVSVLTATWPHPLTIALPSSLFPQLIIDGLQIIIIIKIIIISIIIYFFVFLKKEKSQW